MQHTVENTLVSFTVDQNFTAEQLLDLKLIDSLPKMNFLERMKELNIPGASIAVIDDFKVAWAKGYGVTKAGTDKIVTTDTMFQSASTTKVLMALIVLRLVEEGVFDIDTDVNIYLRSWKIPQHPSGINVTLRMLLTHQSGINRPGNGTEVEEGTEPTLIQFLKGEKPVLNDPVFFDNTPGTVHSYSNFGYMIMQLMLEDHFNTSYTKLVQQFIFEPLHMHSSIIEYPFPAPFADRIICPHNAEGIPSPTDDLNSSPLAQAGLISSPSDLALLACEMMKAHAGIRSDVISQKTMHAMFHIERTLDPKEFEGLSGQGLGVFLFGKPGNHFFVHHGHNNPGANCMFIGSTVHGKGAVIMTNGMYGMLLALETLGAISKAYHWEK